MMLIDRAAVGTGAYARMVRDGVVVPLDRHCGHPADIAPSPVVRAAALAHAVTTHGALSGLAALWVYGWRAGWPPPGEIEVAVARGSHPDPPCAFAPGVWRFVTETNARRSARSVGQVRVVSPAHATAAALMRAPLEAAIPAAAWALSQRLVSRESVRSAIASGPRGPAARRGQAAWEAVSAALQAPQAASAASLPL